MRQSDAMADRETPDVDVPALTAMLDGKYAEIREMTRKNLAEYAGVLDDAIEMPQAEFRERVLELVRLMASTGATGLGFPTEYGGGGDIGLPSLRSRRWASVTSRSWSRSVSSSDSSVARSSSSARRSTTTPTWPISSRPTSSVASR